MTRRLKKLADDGIHLLVEHWRARAIRAEDCLEAVLKIAEEESFVSDLPPELFAILKSRMQ